MNLDQKFKSLTMNSSSSATTNPSSSLPTEISSHDWPEWPQFLTNLTRLGYYNPSSSSSSSTKLIRSELNHDDFRLSPKYFHQAASACLLFAKDHPLLIDSLSKKDIVELVKYALPSLFKGYKTEEKMRAYVRGDENSESKGPHFISEGLSITQMVCTYVWVNDRLEERERDKSMGRTDENNASEVDRAHTVDLMRYILNEVYMPLFSVDRCGPEPYRNLLRELVHETRVVEDSNDKAS